MDVLTHAYFVNLQSDEWDLQYEAYQELLEMTKQEVDWAYEVWEDIVQDLSNRDAHIRSRSAQLLAHLAISDPQKRILDDFAQLWKVTTRDPKFITKRHSMQSIWRVGLAGSEQKDLLLEHLTDWFKHCHQEKNCALIRSDLLQGLRNLYDQQPCEKIKRTVHELIEVETNEKYVEKYKEIWKK
ncbi:hypothetical protein ACFFJI_02460 [Allobacillus sp. GCM10007491]|uniref:hypothetical protein n=1 Tax=Allobacillus TaxID=1400133 RepID=UPI001FEAC9A7|nr:hypothetical protein [Allobacillus salarius]